MKQHLEPALSAVALVRKCLRRAATERQDHNKCLTPTPNLQRGLGVRLALIIAVATLLVCMETAIAQTTHNKLPATCPALNDPYGTDFDWSEISSDDMLEVCLLKLAKNLESPDKMAAWFKEQGFFGVKSHSFEPQQVSLFAHWNLERSGSHAPFNLNWWEFWIEWINRDNLYSAAVIYRNGVPYETTAAYNTK